MVSIKTLYVRVALITGLTSFFRCGMKFTRDWVKLTDVDAATVIRLQEEQMLEVSEEQPADYVDPAAIAATTPAPPAVPTDPAERAAKISAAITTLDTSNAALWTAGGAPTVPAIVAITGWVVTADERNAVWAEINKAPA